MSALFIATSSMDLPIVFAGEVGLDRDGIHILQGHPEVKRILDEHRILVDLLALGLDKPLTDRPDVADAAAALPERREQPQRGRFAVVLVGGGDETRGVSVFMEW